VFLTASVVCAIGFVLTWLVPERPLRATVAATARDAGTEAGETFGLPADEENAEAQLYAALYSLSNREAQREHAERIVARTGESLSPLAAYLLMEIESDPARDPIAIGRGRNIPPSRVDEALDELRQRGLIRDRATDESAQPAVVLSAAGCDLYDRLVAARRAHLAELASVWDPHRDENPSAFLARAVEKVVPKARRRAGTGKGA
jgi:DNA-binding MarR family transcriptional regulator